MTFKAILDADVPNVFLNSGEFAESLTYYAGGTGSGTAIKGILDTMQDLAQAAPGQLAFGSVEISAAAVSAPAIYDTFTQADGTLWRVDSIISGDGYMWRLSISTDHRPRAGGGAA
jgi:hypothetical protein